MHNIIPTLIDIDWKIHRIIPSKFPPINFFETVVSPDQMETAFYIESLTNDRLREEVGDLSLVKNEDRIFGPGASVIMAAFTHIGNPTRFSDGSFGIYYAAKEVKTSIKETSFHRENFMKLTNEEPGDIAMRLYTGKILKPLHDIRNELYSDMHDPSIYKASQDFGRFLRQQDSFGILYNSVRDKNGVCIAALRPTAISIPKQSKHLIYEWNGKKISRIYEKSELLEI